MASSSSTQQNPYLNSGKNYFLTYSRCPLEPEYLKNCLLAKTVTYSPTFIAVSRELHSDGGYHLHSLVMCKSRIYIRTPDWFDFDGFHPNIEAAKSCSNVYAYICKVNDPVTYGTFKNPYSKPKFFQSLPDTTPKNRTFKEIVYSSDSAEDFLNRVKTNFPYEWATKLRGLEYAAEKLHPKIEEPYEPPPEKSSFQIPTPLLNWCKNNLCVINPHFYLISSPYATVDNLKWIVENTDDQLTKLLNPFRVIQDQELEEHPSTSLDQVVPEKPPGPDLLEDITTTVDSSITQDMIKMRSLTSLMTR